MLEKIGAELCQRLKNEFALLGAVKNDGTSNFMTVSWGGFGILWGKEICLVFVRPERHTFEFCEEASTLTLSFFDKSRQSDLVFCGRHSGRDVNKAEACGFKTEIKDGSLYFEEAALTLTLKRLYAQDIEKACFIDTSALDHYKDGGFHRMYICEITEIKENNK